MDFTNFTFLFPPRPTQAIMPSLLNFYSNRGWVAQYKKNGTCTLLYVTPEKNVITKTRHNDDHKRWTPSEKTLEPFKKLPGTGWHVFVVEVLHSKTSTIRDTVYVFDILVHDGKLLLGSTFMERQDLLKTIFNINETCKVVSISSQSHYVINSNVWLSKVVTGDFEKIMKRIKKNAPANGAPEDEGLVLKDPNGKLELPSKQTSNAKWQVKCRIGTKNYAF